MAGVEQNRYKTNNGCIKLLPQTGATAICKTLNDRSKLFLDNANRHKRCSSISKNQEMFWFSENKTAWLN